MNAKLKLAGRIVVTLVFVAGAFVVGSALWRHYMDDPWTRDARVRADVVSVAPDVSGLVSEVVVHDNQAVKRGDVLFRVDRQRFEIALAQANADVAGKQATLDQATRDRVRYENAGESITVQKREETREAEAEAKAALAASTATRTLAQLNLDRSDVKASVNGTVTNLDLRPGDYVAAGQTKIALVDADSLRVEGYFEETKLARLHVGDAVTITLMGQTAKIRGHVESVAAGIEDRERSDSDGTLANVNPTFTWVRLAQRVPVRIALDEVPAGTQLVAGLSATVSVDAAGNQSVAMR